jgi:hypothetical protein
MRLCPLLFLAIAPTAAAVEQTVPLADPRSPAELVVRVPYLRLEVVGSNRTDLSVEILTAHPEGGLPTLPIRARGNRVEIVHPGNEALIDLRIELPARSDLVLESSNGGLVTVTGVEGTVEIVNSNAGVSVEGVGGTLSIATSNGAIRAMLTRVDPEGSVSLLTSNGAIELRLPADFEGRVLAETGGDPIVTDFDITAEPPPGLPRPGRVLSGRIGRGGPLVRLRTENAGIQLLKGSGGTAAGH